MPVFDDQPTTIIAYRWGYGERGGGRRAGRRESGGGGWRADGWISSHVRSVFFCVALWGVVLQTVDACRRRPSPVGSTRRYIYI